MPVLVSRPICGAWCGYYWKLVFRKIFWNIRPLGFSVWQPHCGCLALKSPPIKKVLPREFKNCSVCWKDIAGLGGQYTDEIVVGIWFRVNLIFTAWIVSVWRFGKGWHLIFVEIKIADPPWAVPWSDLYIL